MDKRLPPFCWQSMGALEAVRARFDGRDEQEGSKLSCVTAVGVYATLTEFANEQRCRDGFAVSQTEIAKRLGVARQTVVRYMQALTEAGVLMAESARDERGFRDKNRYVLVEPMSSETTTQSSDATSNVVSDDSSIQEEKEDDSLRSSSLQKSARARERVPEEFPDELRPHARTVLKLLRATAVHIPNAKAVSAMALGNVIMARPYKPLVRTAYDYVAWLEGRSRKHKDLVAGYRNFLDGTDDLASFEPLTESGRPVPGASSTERMPRSRPKEEKLASARERAREAWIREQEEG